MGCINRVGTEAPWNLGKFYGTSYFVDPSGQIFAQASEDKDELLIAEFDLDMIEEVESLARLSVLNAGTIPPNPQELLARGSFAALQARMESRYDVTLYDAAASSRGLDALVLAARCGGLLIVARKNKTHLGDVNALAAQVAQTGAQVVGSVLVEF